MVLPIVSRFVLLPEAGLTLFLINHFGQTQREMIALKDKKLFVSSTNVWVFRKKHEKLCTGHESEKKK